MAKQRKQDALGIPAFDRELEDGSVVRVAGVPDFENSHRYMIDEHRSTNIMLSKEDLIKLGTPGI